MKLDLKYGFTMTELMMVISVLALLVAALAIPSIWRAMERADRCACQSKLNQAIEAFEMYRNDHGDYPPDQIVPSQTTVSGMSDYFDFLGIDWWGEETDLGGRWDWDKGYHFAYSISIWQPTASLRELRSYDSLIDDGDLSQGVFRAVGGQYHYILEE